MNVKNQFGQLIGPIVSNWTTCQKPEKKILQGQYCLLEPIDINKHAVKLFNVLTVHNQDGSWTYLPYGPFDTFNQFNEWLTQTISGQNTFAQDSLIYAILNIKTQEPIGMSGYLNIKNEHGVIEIGHLHFSKLLKQTSLATEAIYLMIKNVFDEYGYRRCEWKCNVLNEPSKQAALRFGFTFEGIFRQHFVFKNHSRDTAWFSMINNEWPIIKEKFEKWLHPNNFSASGEQILKLTEV